MYVLVPVQTQIILHGARSKALPRGESIAVPLGNEASAGATVTATLSVWFASGLIYSGRSSHFHTIHIIAFRNILLRSHQVKHDSTRYQTITISLA